MNVFLSYAAADREFAEGIRKELADSGIEVWDPQTSVLPGDNWGAQAKEALETCDAMVVILSPKAQQSRVVNSEIEFALGNPRYKNGLIPVLIGGTIQAPWADYVNVLSAKDLSSSQAGRKVIEVLNQLPVHSSR